MVQLPFYKTLKNGIRVELDYMQPQEQDAVRSLLNTFIIEGQTYPQDHPLSEAEFVTYWMNRDAFVVRTVVDASAETSGEVLGAFYLKPNFPGHCSHICNAGFIVQPAMRGQGIGRFMGESLLAIAPSKGYEAVMFNLVFETNIASFKLWQSLGFTTIGRIPKAAHLANNQTIEALIMYRSLEVEKLHEFKD